MTRAVKVVVAVVAALLVAALAPAPAFSAAGAAGAGASTVTWDGHRWAVTSGGMAGVANGNPANVTVDSSGFLHLRIVKRGATTTASELFSLDKLGFGTYQWWVQGPVDRMDRATVLGLFPYGPQDGIGTDGENEIDIEFSRWNRTLCDGACNADFTVYPASGFEHLGPTEQDFPISLAGGHLTTARLTWTPTTITEVIMLGLQPLGVTRNVLKEWTFRPTHPMRQIPQRQIPVGMNLWCFQALPATNQEVVIRNFRYVPQRTTAQRLNPSSRPG